MSKSILAVLVVCFVASPYSCAGEPWMKLKATLSAGKAGQIEVLFRNGSTSDVRLNKQAVESGILALEVRDAAGKRVPPITPGLPATTPEFVTIPPGKNFTHSYDLDFFSPPLAAGKYRVRVRLDGWQSNEVEHVVVRRFKE